MFRCFRSRPIISTVSQNNNLPVLLPYNANYAGDPVDLRFSRWLVSSSPLFMLLIILIACIYPLVAMAQSQYTMNQAFSTLWHWNFSWIIAGFRSNFTISSCTQNFLVLNSTISQFSLARIAFHCDAYLSI